MRHHRHFRVRSRPITKICSSRYNLKRKVATLPPLTSEVFTEKVLANQANAAVTAAKATFKKECIACQKMYYSEGAYRTHLASQRHRTLSAKVAAVDHADTQSESAMSSTFSLGEPLETASIQSQAESVSTAVAASEVMEVDNRSKPTSARIEADAEITDTTLSRCLFCNHQSESIDVNEAHMSRSHGMFIPERDYLADRNGLLTFLYQRVFGIHECLYCAQVKHSAPAVQNHMREKGHCMIPYSTEDDMLDVGDYYDFRSTYSDAEDSDAEDSDDGKAGGVRLGAARKSKVTVDNGDGEEVDGEEDEDGWESDASSLSSVPTDEITAIPIDDHSHRYKSLDQHRHHSHRDPRPHRSHDGYHSHAHPTPHAVYHDEYEMQLPSGRVAGHRSLNVYFRQSLKPVSAEEERGRQRAIGGSSAEGTQLARRGEHDYHRQLKGRANGGTGMIGVPDDKKRMVLTAEKRTERRAQAAASRYKAGNEKRGNFQKHFRVCPHRTLWVSFVVLTTVQDPLLQ